MARGFLPSTQSRPGAVNIILSSFSKEPHKKCTLFLGFPTWHHSRRQPRYNALARYSCNSSSQYPIDMSKYREAFSRRMAMAGLQPHHRIALGVSGGPDSMALCVLTVWWKTAGLKTENGGLIDGLLAVIVDHGLRAESKHEADVVSRRVSEMGIRCEIAHCDWSNGRPKLGHLQEAAREMRYQMLQKFCAQHQIGVLLIAHHADDQDIIITFPATFKSELRAVISACQMTRLYVDQFCYSLINEAVVIMEHGYAIIDLKILNASEIVDICLSKFMSLVLQFISQRQRPIRGSALRLLLDYIRTFPCKNSLTAAGCYLCPDPGSRGSRALVCCSVDCPLPLKMEVFESFSDKKQQCRVSTEVEKIIERSKSYAIQSVLDASDVHFMDVTSEFVLTEAKRLNIISESTYRNIIELQREETNRFRSKAEDKTYFEPKHKVDTVTTFKPGQICYFMNRFVVTWGLKEKIVERELSDIFTHGMDLAGESWNCSCMSCVVDHSTGLELRNMIESDWLYLGKLSKYPPPDNLKQKGAINSSEIEQIMEKKTPCFHYACVSARKALLLLKSIPVAVRRSLPVLVNQHGQLLSIPNVNFSRCPHLIVEAEFKPKIPLGGGHSSFV